MGGKFTGTGEELIRADARRRERPMVKIEMLMPRMSKMSPGRSAAHEMYLKGIPPSAITCLT